MSVFTAVQDMSNSSLILKTLKEIGCYFHHTCHASVSAEGGQLAAPGQAAPETLALSGILFPDGVCKNAVDAIRPIAYFLQKKASEEQKKELGEMLAADTEITETLCEGILNPYIQGNPTPPPPPPYLCALYRSVPFTNSKHSLI